MTRNIFTVIFSQETGVLLTFYGNCSKCNRLILAVWLHNSVARLLYIEYRNLNLGKLIKLAHSCVFQELRS